MKSSKTRFQAFLCNIFIALLSVVSIVSYFLLPFWKVEISFCVNAEAIQAFTGNTTESSESTPESEDSPEIGFSMENIVQYIGEEEIPVELSISLETSYILSSFQADAKTTVQQIIDDNVNALVDQLYGPFNQILKNAATAVSKEYMKEQAKEQLKNIYGDEKADSELEQILIDANVNIDEKVDLLINKIYAEDANVDNVSTAIVDTVSEIYEDLRAYDEENFADLQLSEEDKATMKTDMEEMLSEIAEEDGSIDMDNMIANLILNFFNSEEENAEEEVQPTSLRFLEATDTTAAENTDSKEELKTELRNFIMEAIPEGTADMIALGLQGIGYVILFTFFTWAYLIVKILVKLMMPNNSIALKLPIWLGWLPYLMLVLIPTCAMTTLHNPSSLAFLGAEAVQGVASTTEMFNTLSLNLSFSSCSIVSFIIAIVLCLFSIFYYGRLRRQLKKIKQGKIVEEAPTTEETISAEEDNSVDEDNSVETEN